jgi:hypothetical protein
MKILQVNELRPKVSRASTTVNGRRTASPRRVTSQSMSRLNRAQAHGVGIRPGRPRSRHAILRRASLQPPGTLPAVASLRGMRFP